MAEETTETIQTTDVAPAAAVEAPAEESQPKVRRPRRRTKKADADQPAEAPVAEPAAEPEPTPAPAAPEAAEAPAEAPKRRRRRTKKTEDAPAPEAPASDEGDTAASERPFVSIEEMTRMTQEATTASSEPTPLPATTLAQASAKDAAPQEQAPGSRRRRHTQDGKTANVPRNQNDKQQSRRDRRRAAAEPSVTREELAELKVGELRVKAGELGIEYTGMKKGELVEAIFESAARAEGFKTVRGLLEISNEGYGVVRTGNYMEGDDDAFVHQSLVKQYALRPGDSIVGTVAPARSGNKYPPLTSITSVDGRDPEDVRNRPRFRDLTPIFPNERLTMEHGKDSITGRAIDLVAPIGKGQRGLIVSPPKAGKTTVLKRICQSIAANNPEVHLICLLVDERPEEVTDMERSIKGDVVASTFDMPAENHTKVAEMVIEHAKRLVELGDDVVVVLDSITRLARAYNLAQPASGRILSGGVDSAALYPPKKFLGAARNIENGGSLTIIASALVDTGSKMDEVIFEEFKGTGNMELKLDRDLADRRIFPAIDPVSSGTRNEDLLISPELQPFIWGVRRILANMNNTERAATSLVRSLEATRSNEEFLIRSAKKAQSSDFAV
ncbi:MAG: transcription termination factor Rho [Coriobacteriaceae bacterium]|nr:transcription termination factor Rho [Coriobacteriaceae bacterium]